MTNEEIDKMEAGAQIDALVAEKVMEWAVVDWTEWKGPENASYHPHLVFWPGDYALYRPLENEAHGWVYNEIWKPSLYIAAADEVWNKFTTRACFYHDAYSNWQVKLDCCRAVFDDLRWEGWSHTLPLAICHAALKAVNQGL